MMSIQSRPYKNMYNMLLIFLLVIPSIFAENNQSESQDVPACDAYCGCDGLYIYDNVTKECVLDLPRLLKRGIPVRYDNYNDAPILAHNDMARSIYIEGQKLFQGIIISVILFMACASLCVVSACIYCCKINYSDHKLKEEVEALAAKMHKTTILRKKERMRKEESEQRSENCNIIVPSAGVFVV